MKICICNVPLRPYPDPFVPFGCLAVIQSLRKTGHEPLFYNLDFIRPSDLQVIAYMLEHRPDVLGISAVVSTSYGYVKNLIRLVRHHLPDIKVVVGGNLAASAEVLLRKAGVDFCVVGEGELPMNALVEALERDPADREALKEIKGLCFLEADGGFFFTGYQKSLPARDLSWPDYSVLEKQGTLYYYIYPTELSPERRELMPPERRKLRMANVQTSKGCVNRCTFCHRWLKGYRARPLDQIAAHLRYLKKEHNVGSIFLVDEAFGSNPKHARELAALLKELDLIWYAGAVRADAVDPDILHYWYECGCREVTYGTETGSQTILDVMEKHTTVQMNLDSFRLGAENGLPARAVQLVLGMPGENNRTVAETIEFLKQITPHLDMKGKLPSRMFSLNLAMAFPGTPLYEYARSMGLVGRNLEEEEAYLLKVSNMEAFSHQHYINADRLPQLMYMCWTPWVQAEVEGHHLTERLGVRYPLGKVARILLGYYKAFGRLNPPREQTMVDLPEGGQVRPFRFAHLYLNPITRRVAYPLLTLMVAWDAGSKTGSRRHTFALLGKYLLWWARHRTGRVRGTAPGSLRARLGLDRRRLEAEQDHSMAPLRAGR